MTLSLLSLKSDVEVLDPDFDFDDAFSQEWIVRNGSIAGGWEGVQHRSFDPPKCPIHRKITVAHEINLEVRRAKIRPLQHRSADERLREKRKAAKAVALVKARANWIAKIKHERIISEEMLRVTMKRSLEMHPLWRAGKYAVGCIENIEILVKSGVKADAAVAWVMR